MHLAVRDCPHITSFLPGFREQFAIWAGAVEVTDDVQVAVELYASAESFSSWVATEQVGQLHEAEILEVDNVALLGRVGRFRLRNRILRPVEVHTSEIGTLGGEADGRLFRLVADLKRVAGNSGIDLGTDGVDRSENKEIRSFHHSVPVEWIRQIGIGRGSNRVGAIVGAGVKRIDGAAMFVVANGPQQNDSDQGECGGDAASRATLPRADFFIDQPEERRHDQSKQEAGEHDGIEDEHDVPGVPLLGKRPERPDAVVVGEVEKDVAQTGETGEKEENSPARREIWIFQLAAAQTPQETDEAHNHDGIDRNSEKGMREATMMGKTEGGSAQTAEYVEVWGFGGERERKRGQGGLAIESGASQTSAGQEVSDGFQAVKGFYGDERLNAN